MSLEKLERALDPLRMGLQADGMDLVYDGVDDGGSTLVVKLVYGPNACIDCLVPDELMESMLLDSAQNEGLAFARVKLLRSHTPLNA